MMKSLENVNWKKHGEFISIALSSSLLGWIVLSFINTNAHNISDNIFADWNLFNCYAYDLPVPNYVVWMMLFFALAVYFAQVAEWNYKHAKHKATTDVAPRKRVIKHTYTIKITEKIEM